MKDLLTLLSITILFSCINATDEEDFFIKELVPKSGKFDDVLTVNIRFSKPLNKKIFNPSDIQLLDTNNPDSITEISNYEINETGDLLTIYSENVEPDKSYKLLLNGKIHSYDNMLLSYYYGGNFMSDDSYYINKKKYNSNCIVINEVLSYPSELYNKEFIEIFNCSKADIDLRGYYIKIDDFKPQRLLFKNNSYILPEGGYRIILSDVQIRDFSNESLIYVSGKFGKNGISNTSLKSIQLFNEGGRLLSEFKPFDKARRGVSFERINPYNPSNTKNWGFSQSETGSTPCKQNSIFMKDIFPPVFEKLSINDRATSFEISVIFDEDVICESNNCLYLLSNDNQRIPVIPKVSGNTIIFNPVGRINYSSEYTLVATPQLKDVFGNSYSKDLKITNFKTPEMPLISLYYPVSDRIPANTRFFEFLSRSYHMDEESISLKGSIQSLNLICVRSYEEGRYLCTIDSNYDGVEDMCLFINDTDTGLCMKFVEPEEHNPPNLTISNFFQIKDYIYIEADSSTPCILFADFIYKEDNDETFSYSTYSFAQHFEYKIKVPDAYKEYLVEVYCLDMYNSKATQTRFNTNSYMENQISLIINEVLPNPVGIDTPNEFIEIYNNGSEKISSNLISISDCSNNITKINKMSSSYIYPSEVAIIVSNNSTKFINNYECTILSGADKIINRDLRNSSPETLCLFYDGILMDYFNPKFSTSKEGQSIKRIREDLYFDSTNWMISDIQDGTPCILY